jgi:hypothetical protein
MEILERRPDDVLPEPVGEGQRCLDAVPGGRDEQDRSLARVAVYYGDTVE